MQIDSRNQYWKIIFKLFSCYSILKSIECKFLKRKKHFVCRLYINKICSVCDNKQKIKCSRKKTIRLHSVRNIFKFCEKCVDTVFGWNQTETSFNSFICKISLCCEKALFVLHMQLVSHVCKNHIYSSFNIGNFYCISVYNIV